MNVSAINTQTQAYQSLGASVEEAHAAVKAMGDTADKLKRGDPGETSRWLNGGLMPGQAEKIIEQIKNKTKEDSAEYLRDIMKGDKFPIASCYLVSWRMSRRPIRSRPVADGRGRRARQEAAGDQPGRP
jgi:hypothetical protein